MSDLKRAERQLRLLGADLARLSRASVNASPEVLAAARADFYATRLEVAILRALEGAPKLDSASCSRLAGLVLDAALEQSAR